MILKTNFRRTAALAVLLASTAPAAAIAGTVSGTVTDDSGVQGLQSAQLRIVELNRTAETQRGGVYRFPDVPAGTYTLEARYVGAETTTRQITVLQTGDVIADIALKGFGADDILVIGQAANQASALSRKRAADGVSDVLTRDAVGAFPDQNVAESLRRLPGINILNDQGEGRFVSVRGLDPNLNSSSLNGVRLPSPESDVRSVALDVISSDLIESIEVKKSLTPDMDADTIGASIEINTTSAFDRKKDLFSVKLEGSYNELSDEISPKASVDFSTKLTDNFGVAGGLSYYNRKFETDNIEADGWSETDDGFGYADEVQYRDYDVERERISASLSFDYRVDDSTTVYARGIYSQFDDQEFRRRTTFEFREEPSVATATSALFDDADGRVQIERDVKDRDESQKIRSIVVGGETNSGAWNVEYSASWAKSTELENGSVDPTQFRERFNDDGVSVLFDYSNEQRPVFSYPTGADIANDPSRYALNDIELTKLSDAQDTEYAGRVDIARSFAMGAGDFTVQGGFKARLREKSYNFDVEFYEDDGLDYTLADVLGEQTYSFQDIGPTPDKTAPTRFFRDNFDSFELQPEDSIFDSAAGDYSAEEDILATYLLGRWDSDTLRVIAGVRYEATNTDLRGAQVNADTLAIDPLRFKNNYDNWLPSATIRFEPARNLVLRLAGYRSIIRPNLGDLAPNFLINDDDELEAGNPDLRPYKAWNLDAGVEYYFSQNGAISANFFYKDIADFIVDAEFDAGEAGAPTFPGITYREVETAINGDRAKVLGAEFSFSQALNFLPSPLDGFLVQANYTYTDTEATLFDGREIPLPAASKHTFNAVLGYEKGPLSFRVAGTYRDKYLDELGGSADKDRIVDDHFQLDASAKYKITKNFQIFAEWVNITDEPYFAYQQRGDTQRLLQYEEYSWTAKFGIKAKF